MVRDSDILWNPLGKSCLQLGRFDLGKHVIQYLDPDLTHPVNNTIFFSFHVLRIPFKPRPEKKVWTKHVEFDISICISRQAFPLIAALDVGTSENG